MGRKNNKEHKEHFSYSQFTPEKVLSMSAQELERNHITASAIENAPQKWQEEYKFLSNDIRTKKSNTQLKKEEAARQKAEAEQRKVEAALLNAKIQADIDLRATKKGLSVEGFLGEVVCIDDKYDESKRINSEREALLAFNQKMISSQPSQEALPELKQIIAEVVDERIRDIMPKLVESQSASKPVKEEIDIPSGKTNKFQDFIRNKIIPTNNNNLTSVESVQPTAKVDIQKRIGQFSNVVQEVVRESKQYTGLKEGSVKEIARKLNDTKDASVKEVEEIEMKLPSRTVNEEYCESLKQNKQIVKKFISQDSDNMPKEGSIKGRITQFGGKGKIQSLIESERSTQA